MPNWVSAARALPQNVYELFITQLRGLEDFDSALFVKYAYLVERLAMVKVFVLMLDFSFDDLLRQLIEVLLGAACEQHPVRVAAWMESIVTTTLLELSEEEITPPLLDAILEHLLPASREQKPP